MHLKVVETGYSIKETMNGLELRRYRKNSHCFARNTHFKLDLVLLSRENTVLETAAFRGDFQSTVMDIKKAFRSPADVFLNDSGIVSRLDDADMPFNRVFEVQEGELVQSYKAMLLVRSRPGVNVEILRNFPDLSSLRRLVIQNFPVARISLQSQKRLRYLKLNNASLELIIPTTHSLEYCNLGNNLLKECSVRAKTLIVPCNKIELFESSFRFKHLDISDNPLTSIVCSTDFLNVKNTCLRHVLHSNARTILADGTKNVRLGCCPRLVSLSVNDCELTHVNFSVARLRIFKARNNYFQSLPKLKSCLSVNMAGNFLASIDARKAKVLDISKNQFVSFDLNRFRSLEHLNLSFNPLGPSSEDEKGGPLTTVVLNNSQKCYSGHPKAKKILKHNCPRVRLWNMLYRLTTMISQTPVTVFVLVQAPTDRRYCGLLAGLLDSSRNDTSWMYLFSRFSEQAYLGICKEQPSAKASFVLITNESVMVRSFGIENIFMSFAEVESLNDSDIIRVFNNVSSWSVFPVFCKIQPVSSKRRYAFFSDGKDLVEMFQFLGHYCPRSIEFLITNSSEFFDHQKPRDISDCQLVKVISGREYGKGFVDMVSCHSTTGASSSNELLGIENVDFGLGMFRNSITAPVFITSSNPIFLFMKIIFNSGRDFVLEHEERNLMSIFDFYCKVFGGRLIEKSYRLYIVGFDSPIQSALWALRVQNILKAVNIDVCIGISGDVVFRTEEDGVVYFGGPALNKTSRISDLGTGVFCCACIKFNHPLIELIDEGERFLKGFDKRHRIFSLRLSNRCCR